MDLLSAWGRFAAALVAACVASAAAVAAAPAAINATEAELKAAYIYNFAKFVEWPASSPVAIEIDVVEADAVAAALKRTIEGKPLRGLPVTVRVVPAGEVSPHASIVVIGTTGDGAVAWQLERLKGRAVLTIGESPRFLQLGGMIQFRSADERLQFDINPRTAAEHGLQVSAKLLVLTRGNGGR